MLADADGTPLADVLLDDAAGHRWAVLLALHAPPEAVAPAVVATYGAHRVVTDNDDLVALLVAAGGVVARRAHDYVRDLADVPEAVAPQGFSAPDPDTLAEAHAAAYGPGHPDHDPGMDHAAELRRLLSGEVIGPIVREATWQADARGAVIVCERTPELAWVLDVFGPGVGRALMTAALAGAKRAGYRQMGLVVTDGNPARRLYESLGFTHTRSGSSIDLR